jgi:hypothetical protein
MWNRYQGGDATFSYRARDVFMPGVPGITPSGNTIIAAVSLSFPSSIDGSQKVIELVTGSTVVTGTEENPEWNVVLWGEVESHVEKASEDIQQSSESSHTLKE